MPILKSKKKTWITIIVALLAVALVAVGAFLLVRYLKERREAAERQEWFEGFYASKLESFAKENEQYADYEVDVAFIGDSLTDGYDVKSWYPQYVVVNRGIGGDTTIRLEERLQVSLYDLKPKVVVMLIGANNMSTMFENYEQILQSLQQNLPDSKVVLMSLTSMGGEHWGKNNQLAAYNNVKIKLLAEKYQFEFVDLYSQLMNLETGEIYEEYTTDGGHLTPKGYGVFTETLTPTLERLLENE